MCVMPPLVPVIVTVYVPGVVLCNVLIVSVDVPDPPELSETLDELRVSLGPVGEQVAEIATLPVKPLMLAKLMVTVPVEPAARLSELTLVSRLKSCTFTVITTE